MARLLQLLLQLLLLMIQLRIVHPKVVQRDLNASMVSSLSALLVPSVLVGLPRALCVLVLLHLLFLDRQVVPLVQVVILPMQKRRRVYPSQLAKLALA